MADTESKALKAKDKMEITTPTEQMKPGLVFTPAVDIFETDRVLSLAGEVNPLEGPNEVVVLREYETGKYVRQFNLSEVIDQSKIEANLTEGVLRLILPKVEPATPRKIKVKTG